jgi:hypothetical protein
MKELDRRWATIFVPPDAHEQIHRYQRDLEEDIEQN